MWGTVVSLPACGPPDRLRDAPQSVRWFPVPCHSPLRARPLVRDQGEGQRGLLGGPHQGESKVSLGLQSSLGLRAVFQARTYRQVHTDKHRHAATQTDTYRHTSTHRDTQRDTETHRETQRHTQTHTGTQTDMHRHTETHTHRHLHTHTHTHTQTQGHAQTGTDTHAHTHRHTDTVRRAVGRSSPAVPWPDPCLSSAVSGGGFSSPSGASCTEPHHGRRFPLFPVGACLSGSSVTSLERAHRVRPGLPRVLSLLP